MLEPVKQNIDRLIALYEGEKQRADQLAARLSESEASVRSYVEQITELNHQIDNLKLSSAFASGNGNSEAKDRLAKLIAEIDRCIALLEK